MIEGWFERFLKLFLGSFRSILRKFQGSSKDHLKGEGALSVFELGFECESKQLNQGFKAVSRKRKKVLSVLQGILKSV